MVKVMVRIMRRVTVRVGLRSGLWLDYVYDRLRFLQNRSQFSI